MLQITIDPTTPANMLRAIRAACNELLGETHADLTTQAAEHVTRANELQAAADAEAHKAAAALSAHNATEVSTAGKDPDGYRHETVFRQELNEPPLGKPAEELDSAGHTWNAELHASTKSKNADGTWKKRRGSATGPAIADTVNVTAVEEPCTVIPSAPPLPPAAHTAEPVMSKIFALITSQIVTINQAVEAAQAEGFADLGANGLGGAPVEKQLAVLRKLEG